LTKATTDDGAEQINREAGQRYIAIKYSVRAAISAQPSKKPSSASTAT
jgi:hypothetical protein